MSELLNLSKVWDNFSINRSSLKIIKNAFYFTLKALFVLNIFQFLSRLFDHVEKQLDKKNKVEFKISDVTTWLASNCVVVIAQYLKK